jgi:hypothetical protein
MMGKIGLDGRVHALVAGIHGLFFDIYGAENAAQALTDWTSLISADICLKFPLNGQELTLHPKDVSTAEAGCVLAGCHFVCSFRS